MEASTWSQDKKGWTTCYFNRLPDLATIAKNHGGIEDPDKSGFTFKTTEDAVAVAKLLGEEHADVGPIFEGRRVLLKPHKDGRLVMEIERKKGDADLTEPDDWLPKKTKWVRIFETTIQAKKENDDLEVTEYEDLIRAVENPGQAVRGLAATKQGQPGMDRSPSDQHQNAASEPGPCQG